MSKTSKLYESLLTESIENFSQALQAVAKKLDYSEKYIVDNGIVNEYEAEEDLSEFTAWYDKEGKRVPSGTGIGFSVLIDGDESLIIAYVGLTEVDEEPEDDEEDE